MIDLNKQGLPCLVRAVPVYFVVTCKNYCSASSKISVVLAVFLLS